MHAIVRTILGSLALTAPASAQLARPVVTTLPNHPVQVKNSGPSAWLGTNGWKLVLERTITPVDGSPGMISLPSGIGVDRNGRIVVGDWKASGLLLYEADGRFIRTIGRTGEGPGEFRPSLDFDIRGDTIGGYAPNNARSLAWRTDGTFLGQWRSADCCIGGGPVLDGKGGLLVPTGVRIAGANRDAMVRWTFDGAAHDTILLPPHDPNPPFWRVGQGAMPIPLQGFRSGVFDSKGRYIHGHPSTYTLIIAAHGSDTTRIVTMPGKRMPIPTAFADSVFKKITERPPLNEIAKRSDLPTEHPFFTGLHTDELDNIWIERPAANGTVGSFDVMNPDGVFLGSVASPGGAFRRATWRNGRLYRITENGDGVPVIEVYRVVKGGT